MKTMRLPSVMMLALVQLACGGAGAPERAAVDRQATVVPPEWSCSTVTFYLGRSFGEASYLIDDPLPATYAPIDAAGDSITLGSSDGIVWSWTSTALIRAIFIRADVPGTVLGDATNQVWMYVPPQPGGAFSGAVYTEDGTNQRYPAKQIEFCFDPPPPEEALQVTKTAVPRYEEQLAWSIAKRAGVESVLLSAGRTVGVAYQVEVQPAGATASDFGAEGQILIHNPAAVAATLTGVTDSMEGMASGTLDCGVVFPFTLAPGADLTCAWSGELPDAATRVNTATVTTEGAVAGGSATATVDFTGVPASETIDECVTVSDDRSGELGVACADAPSTTWSTTLQIGPYEACGEFEFANVATFVTHDTRATGSAGVTLPVTVPCEGGCTLTPGYWKTHSKYGPAPFDDGWTAVGEDTAFFLSGLSWYRQFFVSPAGNAYFQLSHQYAAAALNQLNGASSGAAGAALAQAAALLQTYTPAQIAALKGGSSVRAAFISAASTLASYNAGGIGPGHCSE